MTGTLTIDFTLSILVPVYNEKELLPFFIEHIRQKMSKKHELILRCHTLFDVFIR